MTDETKVEAQAITIPCQADKEMELTPEEQKHLSLNAGVRGQVKKIMRVFINDQRSVMERFTLEVTKAQTAFRERYLGQVNDALTRLDKRFSGLYGDLVNRFLVKQESRVFFAELHVRALRELTIKALYDLKYPQNADVPVKCEMNEETGTSEAVPAPELRSVPSFDDFSKEFTKQVEDRVTALYKEISDQAEKEQAEKAKGETTDAGQAGKDEAAAPNAEQGVGAEQSNAAENGNG